LNIKAIDFYYNASLFLIQIIPPIPANLQFAGVEYGDLQSLSMAEAFMAVISFSAANIAVFSEKQGRNVCVFSHCKC